MAGGKASSEAAGPCQLLVTVTPEQASPYSQEYQLWGQQAQGDLWHCSPGGRRVGIREAVASDNQEEGPMGHGAIQEGWASSAQLLEPTESMRLLDQALLWVEEPRDLGLARDSATLGAGCKTGGS